MREDPAAREIYETLVEGITGWMAEPLQHWFDHHWFAGRGFITNRHVHRACALLRIVVGSQGAAEELRSRLGGHPEGGVDVIDALLRTVTALESGLPQSPSAQMHPTAKAVDEILHDAGSVWRVVLEPSAHFWTLQRRVERTVAEAAALEFEANGNAGEHLRLAWHAVYRVSPDPSSGHRDAVRAVEAAAKSTVTPADGQATLGKMITAMRDAPAKWDTTIGEISDVRRQMEIIWKAQYDRHGTDDPNAPLSVSLDEAEAALHVALQLVHAFRSGAVRRAGAPL
jgi:hypothetical protein